MKLYFFWRRLKICSRYAAPLVSPFKARRLKKKKIQFRIANPVIVAKSFAESVWFLLARRGLTRRTVNWAKLTILTGTKLPSLDGVCFFLFFRSPNEVDCAIISNHKRASQKNVSPNTFTFASFESKHVFHSSERFVAASGNHCGFYSPNKHINRFLVSVIIILLSRRGASRD